jgi:hypothetical protein
MEGVYFSDNNLHYFKSKRCKMKLKNIFKKEFRIDEENFVENINKRKEELIDKFMNKQKLVNYNFNITKKSGKNGVRLEVELLMEENNREIQKIKLHDKIKKIKEENLKEKTIKNNIKIKKKLKKDNRVTKEMEILYKNALVEIKDIDDPKEILDDLNYYKEELNDYLEEIENNDYTPYAKYLMYNNSYTNYLSYMTGIKIKIPNEIIKQKNELTKIVNRKVV